MRTLLSVAALAALLTGGSVATVQAACSALGGRAAYVQMNSPYGFSPGAARHGNGRPRGMRYRGWHR